jgi:predicted nucleic acid-binding protein
LPSGGTAGEVLGCLCGCAVASSRAINPATPGACGEGFRNARVVASAVECVSALARLERDGALDPAAMTLALQRLHKLSAGWHEIDPSDEIRETAARFLRVHPLRAADALQLAAAFAAAERRPASLEIVTLDERLANAASKEGFTVLNLTEAE